MLSLKQIILVSSLFITGITHAQFGFEYSNSIRVSVNGDSLLNPWAGGLNYVQVSDFDFDFDGDADLFIFDRSNDNIRVYTQEIIGGTPTYRLAYGASEHFPADVRDRAALVDYDNDGRKDLWTYVPGGLKIYRNVGDITNGLQWVLVEDLLYSEYVGGSSNLIVTSVDIPAIEDIDFDGDIDILTFNQGGKYMEYHQNQSMELYGIPDSLIFELKNECWGKFSEDFSTNVITLDDPNAPCSGGSIPNPLRTANESQNPIFKHAGSTVLAIDYDNSGVMDLVLGDVSFPTLTLLLNGGTAPNTNSTMISQDNAFPSNTTPADIQLFPAAFFVDVDFDQVKDLVVTANARNISENETSIRYFKNIGTNALPNFIYQANNLFQNEMIDHGTGSIPVFFDYDEDGLEDLFIGNFFRYIPVLDKESTIAYYKNTGTATEPEFSYVDYNFLNLDIENYGLRTVPTFGDIDGDGDKDLFLGTDNGTLVYYPNNSTGSGAVWGTPIQNYPDNNGDSITASSYAHPQLFDLDQDGLLDLLIGNKAGNIVYYKNIGTTSSPLFEHVTNTLGNVDVSNALNSYSSPHFFRDNGETVLFVGSVDGNLLYYDSIDQNLDLGDTFHLVHDQYLNINVESYSSFAVNDIDGDGNYNLFVGQDLGGLFHFKANPNSNIGINEISAESTIALYPNPGTDFVTLAADHIIQSWKLCDLNGRVFNHSQAQNDEYLIDIAHLSSGVYVFLIELENGSHTTKKLVKQ